ncbi:hypothetical protein C8F04DRAFT_1119028 [Mycena alexandri]|uniref:F-box domain-containing protein n=1 Tax=Mycena alexandri TaxID=1745969 RepID=A0AAD6SKQ8_9AGAR|nr:hypothetical protein C8F04DRAFT_1119028 [Mycena alexandri]
MAASLPLFLNSKEDVMARINETEEKIRRLTSQIDELSAVRQKERRSLAQLWFMIVPVGRLPTELLSEIFTLAVQATVEPDLPEPGVGHQVGVLRHLYNTSSKKAPFGVGHPIHQALRISQICSSWRAIAIGTPALWAAGVFDVQLNRPKYSPEKLDGMKALLKRSSPLPISVSLDCQYQYAFDEDVNTITIPNVDILLTMLTTCGRWRDLKLFQDAADALIRLGSRAGPFTALETLDLQYASEPSSGPIQLFLESPRLRRLCSTTYDQVQSNVLQMPWTQLTYLDLQEPSLPRSRTILSECTNLVSATLVTREWDPTDGEFDAPPTVLSFLRALKAEFYEDDNPAGGVAPFFASLFLPALETLDLEFDVPWPVQEFSAFQRGAPNIVDMTLRSVPITSDELVTVLRLAPALTALSLICCENCTNDDFLDAFSYGASNAPQLVPRLQTFQWQVIGVHFQLDKLEAAIRSRRWIDDETPRDAARLRLEKITISIIGGDSETFIDRLQDLVHQGLTLSQS